MRQAEGLHRLDLAGNSIAILELLAKDSLGLTVAHIASELGMKRSMVFSLMSSLEVCGFVERNVQGVYHPDLLAVAVVLGRLLSKMGLLAHARPILDELARKHGEAVYLTVLRDDEVIFLDMADYAQHEQAASFVGKRFPSLASAAGKAIRALQSRDLLTKLFSGRRKRKIVYDQERLFAELDAIKSSGVAVDMGALGDGLSSVATAVRDYAGKVVCALTVVGPSFRMVAGRLENEIIPSLVEGAELLSMKFGYARAT
jgi:DNA-binding IclR family transcriptional regulator